MVPVAVLKTCEPEVSYILAELFDMALKESFCWKVLLMVPAFKNVGKRSAAKNCCPFNLLCVVSKFFDMVVIDMIVDHLEKCGLFSDFHYGFKSS